MAKQVGGWRWGLELFFLVEGGGKVEGWGGGVDVVWFDECVSRMVGDGVDTLFWYGLGRFRFVCSLEVV